MSISLALVSASKVSGWIAELDSLWIWGAALLALLYAMFDTKNTREEIKQSAGLKKKLLRLKLLMLWLIPVFGLLGAYASGLASKTQEDKIGEMGRIIQTNDIKNLTISDITANARLQVAGPLGDHGGFMLGTDLSSYMVLMESNSPPNTLHLGAFQNFYVTDLRAHETLSAGPTNHGYTFGLRRDLGVSGDVTIIRDGVPTTAGMVLSRVNWAHLRLDFVPPHSTIIGGSIDLLINGSLKKQFAIPSQICASNGTLFATSTAASPH